MLQLALHNLSRNYRRSLVTVTAIMVGVWGLIFIWAFIDGINEQMIINNIQYLTGHFKVHRLNYHEERELALSMPAEVPASFSELPPDSVYAPRIEGYALIGNESSSTTVMVYGVDPQREPRVTTLNEAIIEGRYLLGDDQEIVIGDALAAELAVGVGGTIDVIVQTADGSIGADRFNLVGIFDSGIDTLDESLVFLPLPQAQELYSMWGQYSAWSIKLANRQQVGPVSEQLSTSLGANYEVYQWTELLPSVVQAVRFHEAIGYVVLSIVFVVVAAGIVNTISMSVLERTHEFGVMRALGTQPVQILWLVIVESVVLGLVGVIAGNLFGVPFTQIWTERGMDLSQYTEAMETMPGLSGTVFPFVRADHLLLISAIVFLICLLPALPPAWKASRMKPVEAINGASEKAAGVGRIERLNPMPAAWLWGRLAWRNLFRNRKRTLVTGAATAFGTASFVFLYAFTDGFFEQMIDNSTQLLTAHVQISASESARDEAIFDNALLPAPLVQSSDIIAMSARLSVPVMVSSAKNALPVDWIGVDPARETSVTRIDTLITDGSYLQVGEPGMVIGRSLADELEIEVGRRIVITGQDENSQLISTAVMVTGIYSTNSELFDIGYIFSSIEELQAFIGVSSENISHVALNLTDRRLSTEISARINQQLGNSVLQARPWEEIMPVVVQMVEMTRVDFYLVLAVIYLVVCIGVMNTMLMSVFERTREFGVLLALGTSPGQVVKTLLLEASLIGAAGILVGAATGVILAIYYGDHGINLSAFMESMAAIPGMTDRVYPELIVSHLIVPTIILYVAGVLVSIYPALRAANLHPVEAIRAQ